MIVRSAVVGPFAANSWIVACEETGDAVLVDPGGDVPGVLGLLPAGGRVTRIVCTHGHVDHVAGGAAAREATRAPLAVHPDDAGWLEALPRQAEMFGFEPAEPPVVDEPLVDGATMPVGRSEAQVIHTPGHSAGSCCLWFPREKLLFTGDTLFAGSVGRTDLPGGDFDALYRSIRERLFPLGDEVRFFPGHGPAATLGDERASNPFVGEQRKRGRYL